MLIAGCSTIQPQTSFVQNVINTCIDDCQKTSNETDCSDLCTEQTMNALNDPEIKNEAINKYGDFYEYGIRGN